MNILKMLRAKPLDSIFYPKFFDKPLDIIDVANVSDYYYSQSQDESDAMFLEDLPTVLPKGQATWLEYRLSDLTSVNSGYFNKFSYGYMANFGEYEKITITGFACLMLLYPHVDFSMLYGKDELSLPNNAAYTLDVYSFQSYTIPSKRGENFTGGFNQLRYILDKDGAICLLESGQFQEWQLEVYSKNEKAKAIFYSEDNALRFMHAALDKPRDRIRYISTIMTFASPFLLANTFIQSKNTILIDKDMGQKIKPKRKIKRIGRKKRKTPYSPKKTKIIAIKPLQTKVRVKPEKPTENAGKRKNSRLKAHFRTYSKDKPMFGRAGMHGTFLITGFGYDDQKNEQGYIIKLT